MRLAWFTPLPPVRSGIAAYSMELVPCVAADHAIDVYVDGPAAPVRRIGSAATVLSAHDFLWKQERRPYDLVVYQIGNATCHGYMWAYLVRYPGLVVLHDGLLHHSRAERLLTRGRQDDYRAELRHSHPDAPPDVAELAIAGLDGHFYYLWPMVGAVVRAARALAVHSPWLRDDLLARYPDVPIETIAMGVPDPVSGWSERSDVRARHRVPKEAVLVTAFGGVTPEKRLEPALRALGSLASAGDPVHLMLVGETATYFDVRTLAAELGMADRLAITGFVRDEELGAYLGAADLCLCLRWPSARESSASWLRALAAGRATVVTDLAHVTDVPALDPRSWTVIDANPAGLTPREPVCVAIDILDEDHSLRLALGRLVRDAPLRRSLGEAARKLWAARHTLEHMARDYRRVIGWAAARPLPEPARLPSHLTADGGAHARRLAAELGSRLDILPSDPGAASP